MEDGMKWVTLKDGRQVKIRDRYSTNELMNTFIKSKGGYYLDDIKRQGDERMKELRNIYGEENYSKEGKIEKISVYDRDIERQYKPYQSEKTTSQEELNSLPIALRISGYDSYGVHRTSDYIYRNRAQMFKDINTYGGLNSMTDKGKSSYIIYSVGGKGEYYLDRNKYKKGGWNWVDGSSGYDVSGSEDREFGKYFERNIVKKHGQEYYDRLFGKRD